MPFKSEHADTMQVVIDDMMIVQFRCSVNERTFSMVVARAGK